MADARPAGGRRRRRARRRAGLSRPAALDRRHRPRDLRRARRRRSSCSTRRPDELVFEAVSGEGSETLIGQRLPQGTGIAGWVLAARQPLVLDDVGGDPRFARDVAEATGYVPSGLMAVPLLHGDGRSASCRCSTARARASASPRWTCSACSRNQAAIALDLLQKGRRARGRGRGRRTARRRRPRCGRARPRSPRAAREDALALLTALERVLAQ